MFNSNDFNINNLFTDPENDNSGFHFQEANPIHASPNQDLHHNISSWTLPPVDPIQGFQTLLGDADCIDIYQPSSLTSLDISYAGSNVINQDHQMIIINYEMNGADENNFEDSNLLIQSGHETGQFNCLMNGSQVLNDVTNSFENSNEQMSRVNESTIQSNIEAHGLIMNVVPLTAIDSDESKSADKSQVSGDDISETMHILDYDIEYAKWLQRPADYLKEASLWMLLWKYGVQYLETMNDPRKDYM